MTTFAFWTFTALIGALAAYYVGVVGAVAWGFRRVQADAASPPPRAEEAPTVSVIVPARNEADTIGACLDSILANTYPSARFEVIVVDDGSTDATAAEVRRRQAPAAASPEAVPAQAAPAEAVRAQGDGVPATPPADLPAPTASGADPAAPSPPLRLVETARHRSAAEEAGLKHRALDAGIAEATGEIVLTTDADCTVRPDWIASMVERFTPTTALVSGPVRYQARPRWFDRVQDFEFMTLIAFGAGSIGAGFPTICNSANLAYRRDVYQALRPNWTATGPASDETLLQRLAYATDWDVAFNADRSAVVETHPAASARAFLSQRQRWARMGTRYPHAGVTGLLAGVFAFYLALVVGLTAAPFTPGLGGVMLGAFGLKMGVEATLLVPTLRHFQRTHRLPYLLLLQPLHALYVVYVGLTGTVGRVHWKGRVVD